MRAASSPSFRSFLDTTGASPRDVIPSTSRRRSADGIVKATKKLSVSSRRKIAAIAMSRAMPAARVATPRNAVSRARSCVSGLAIRLIEQSTLNCLRRCCSLAGLAWLSFYEEALCGREANGPFDLVLEKRVDGQFGSGAASKAIVVEDHEATGRKTGVEEAATVRDGLGNVGIN